jgi:hypothetical protein
VVHTTESLVLSMKKVTRVIRKTDSPERMPLASHSAGISSVEQVETQLLTYLKSRLSHLCCVKSGPGRSCRVNFTPSRMCLSGLWSWDCVVHIV